MACCRRFDASPVHKTEEVTPSVKKTIKSLFLIDVFGFSSAIAHVLNRRLTVLFRITVVRILINCQSRTYPGTVCDLFLLLILLEQRPIYIRQNTYILHNDEVTVTC